MFWKGRPTAVKTIIRSEPIRWMIERSTFIAQVIRFPSSQLLPDVLTDIRSQYPDATHYVYAYRISEREEKGTDDGEPSGTAGLPVLRTLSTHNAVESLAFVIRYFGGIKLGHGGLVRAYQKSAQMAVEVASWGTLVDGWRVTVRFPYTWANIFDRHLRPAVYDLTMNFTDTITATCIVPQAVWSDWWQDALNRTAAQIHLQSQEAVEFVRSKS